MANQFWEVITVLDSDDDSESKVESTATVRSNVRSKKTTARKSVRSGMPVATVKKESHPMVSQSSVANNGNANHIQTTSSNSTENSAPPHKTARKSLKNSNFPTASELVSILKNSSNLQSAPVHSKNENGSLYPSKIPNVVTATSKLKEITITPVPSSSTETVKVLPTAQKPCNSHPPSENIRTSNKYFMPISTSTPKLSNAVRKKVAPGILASFKKTSSLAVTNKVKPCSLPGTTISTGLSSTVPKILPTDTVIKIPPSVSLQPVIEKRSHLKESTKAVVKKSAQNSKSDVPVSLLTYLGKAGTTITKAFNGNVGGAQSNIKIKSKDKKTVQNVNNDSIITIKSLDRVASKNNSNSVTTSISEIGNVDQRKKILLKENLVGNLAVPSGIVITPVSIDSKNINEQINQNRAIVQNETNSPVQTNNKEESTVVSTTTTEKSVKNCLKKCEKHKTLNFTSGKNPASLLKMNRLDKIVNSIKKTNSVGTKDIQRKPVSNLGSQISKDPLETLRSNSDVTVRTASFDKKSEINTKNVTSPVKDMSKQGIEGNTRKRAHSQNDFDKGTTNKKQKKETKPSLNVNPTAEENLQRIAALKESLERLSANTVHSKPNSSAKKDNLSGFLTRHPEKVIEQSASSIRDGNKDSVGEEAKFKNMTTDGILKEKPFKQVTSPKLSLKRKRIEDALKSSEKKVKVDSVAPNQVIPLPYVKITKSKLTSQVARNKAIPLPYKAIPLPYIQLTNSTPNQVSAAPHKVDSVLCTPITSSTPIRPSVSCELKQKSDNSVPWSSADDNTTKFKKLLEFSKTFMTATTAEKCTIVKNFHKLLDKANPTYVNSAEFDLLLNDTLKNIKDSKDTFVHLQTIKTELKAYKRKKESDQSLNSSHRSSSSERGETTKFASNLGLPTSKPPKEVPEPILVEHLASAIRSVRSNLKLDDSHMSVHNSYPLSNIPSTSKQADIVENFRLSMPVNNNVVTDLRNIPSTSKQADIIDNLHLSMPGVDDATSTSDLRNPTSKQQEGLLKQCSKYFNDKTSAVNLEETASKQTDLVKNLSLLNDQRDTFNKQVVCNNEGSVENQDTMLVKDSSVSRISNGVKLQEESLKPPFIKPASLSKNVESKKEKFEKRVKFLERHLAKLDKKIKKLQSRELSLDDMDDEDSTYILEDKYKLKFQKTWATLCRIKKRSPLVGREIDKHFTYKGSRHGAINKAVEKLINKKKRAEKFPSYVDVLNLIQKINDNTHLSLSSVEIESEAREAFENVGIELKKRRLKDEEQDFGCYLTDNLHLETDPADADEELNEKLKSSVVEGEKKIKEIIDKYAAQQRVKAPSDQSVEEEGSDCEELHSDEPTEENSHRLPLGEENSTGVDDLPDTDPATPDTDPAIPDPNPATPDTNPATPDTNPATSDANAATPNTSPATPNTNPATPNTNPATPDTDECEGRPEIVPGSLVTVSAPPDDVIDIGSSSDASTEPGLSVAAPPNTTFIPNERIFINDEIEIIEDNQHYDTDSSPDLPSISELCR